MILGKRPINSIVNLTIPFEVRFNCKDGGLFIGGADAENRITASNELIEMNIVKATLHYGSLGSTRNCIWLQVFWIPTVALSKKIGRLPLNTVCVSYFKKQSVSNLSSLIQGVMTDQVDPGEGIFVAKFEKQLSSQGAAYYTVNFHWRARQTEEESGQLNLMIGFLGGNPSFVDLGGTQNMVSIDGMSGSDVQEIVKTTLLGESTAAALPPSK